MRTKLVEELAYKMRYAENHFLKTEDDCKKHKVMALVEKANLTNKEQAEFNAICLSMGV